MKKQIPIEPGDRYKDKCGVFGVYTPRRKLSELIYYGLYALQHRGQESAGMAISDGADLLVFKDMGLVSQVFSQNILQSIKGNLGIGHVRYSTTGSSYWANAQPVFGNFRSGSFALGHNGNLVNSRELAMELSRKRVKFNASSDTEIIARMIERGTCEDIIEAISSALGNVVGAYSLAILTEDRVIAVRDPNGFRPLCFGEINGGFAISSESCAINAIGGDMEREVNPGEMIILSADGCTSFQFTPQVSMSLCIFEFIYFSRPDSVLNGKSVYQVRYNLGARLAEEAPVDADLVIPIPDSGFPAAIGFSERSGIPFGLGLIKNKYIGRTFIQPSQAARKIGINLKLNPLRDVIKGKRLVVVDDSIVRGNTSLAIVRLLYDAGAREVHMRICSPPIRHSCYYGIDMVDPNEFIATGRTIKEIENFLGVDSLHYISYQGLVDCTGIPKEEFCLACLDGDYPIACYDEINYEKLMLEKIVNEK